MRRASASFKANTVPAGPHLRNAASPDVLSDKRLTPRAVAILVAARSTRRQ
jgi:hypothetical protein